MTNVRLHSLRNIFYVSYRFVKYSFFLFLAIWFVLIGWISYEHRRICVELPNGLLIGYRAYFNVAGSRLTWRVPTIKLPDGTVLLEPGYRVDRFVFSESTVYGVAHPAYGSEGRRWGFIYRPDIGFKEEYEIHPRFNEERERDLIHHPGLTTAEGRLITTGAWTTYKTLIRDGIYRREKCPLDIFAIW